MTRVTLSESVGIGPTELRVIERLQISVPGMPGASCGLASKQPVAVVVRTGDEIRALDLEGHEIPLHRLRAQYPHLHELDGP